MENNNPTEHGVEVRLALLESDQRRTFAHHEETKKKLDHIIELLNEKECTLHAARMLQLDQDVKEIKKDNREILTKLAFLSGIFAIISFIATRIWK